MQEMRPDTALMVQCTAAASPPAAASTPREDSRWRWLPTVSLATCRRSTTSRSWFGFDTHSEGQWKTIARDVTMRRQKNIRQI
jgi:hypothetical protein